MILKNQLSRALLVGFLLAAPALADESLMVEVLRADNDKPISGAVVRVQDKAGQGAVQEGKTDETGHVRIPGLAPGDYYVEIRHPDYGGDRSILKITQGAEATYKTLLDPAGQERVIKIKESRLWMNPKDPNDGAVTRRDRDFTQRQLADRSLQGVLATVPGVNNDSVGQVHVRGEHKALTVALDGVNLPIPLASSTSPLIDPDFLDGLNVRNGAYNGTQSGQGGLILDAETNFPSKPYFELRPKVGNLGQQEMLLRFGGSTPSQEFSYFVAAKTGATDLQFEAPHPEQQTLNNRGQYSNVLVRMQGKGDEDTVNLSFSHQTGLFGIAQTPQNYLAGVRQTQEDSNTLGLLSWKRTVDEDTDLQMAVSYLRSRQQITNNGVFTPFAAFDPTVSAELAEEGLPADPLNPGAPYLPFTRTTITQIQPSIKMTHRMGPDERIVAGGDANFIHSVQDVDILDPGGGGGLPDAAPRFRGQVARQGFSGGLFFSHTRPLAEQLTVNYGLRLDRFDNGVNVRTDQLSPFLNFAYAPGPDDSIRFSYNRLFQAPPLELDLSFSTNALPQRIHLFELSYERQLGDNMTAKVAYVHKLFRDQIDIGQLLPLANIPIYAPVNFAAATYRGLELSFSTHNKTGWNGFVTATISEARPTRAGVFTTELPEFNDHDQRVQATGGVSYSWDNGLTAATDFYYGSGYPQSALALYNQVGIYPYGYNAERVGRFLTNLSLNYWPPAPEDGAQVGGSLQILNLFDERPLLNFYSEFSGTRFISQRRVLLNGMVRF